MSGIRKADTGGDDGRRNDKNTPKRFDSVFFWETARRFLDHELPKIRKKSGNTVASYRSSLNTCIDFLEEMKGICRERVCSMTWTEKA